MLTPAQFERQMKIYKDQLNDICVRNPVETEKSWNQKADVWDKIYADMCDVLTTWGYKTGVDIIKQIWEKRE